MFDALLEICSIHIGLMSQNFNFLPTFFTPLRIPRNISLNMCPPSNGTIGIRFVKPSKILTHNNHQILLPGINKTEYKRKLAGWGETIIFDQETDMSMKDLLIKLCILHGVKYE